MTTKQEFYISPLKKTELEEELRERKEETRQSILEKLQYAKSLGDLSENAEYHDARERQGKNESRIQEIEHILKHAVLVQKKDDGTVGLGSEIVIAKTEGGKERSYTIVGPAEADMSAGRLSSESPLGAALMGHATGDIVDFESPKGTIHYKIVTVS